MANNFTIASFIVDNNRITCCVMQYDKNAEFGAQFPIIDWRIIDTSDTAIVSGRICDGITTTNTPCTRTPSVVVDNSCYCERHAFQNSKSIPNIKFRTMPLKKICMKLIESLNELNDMWSKRIDHVVIESQYLTKRKTMCISDMVYGYFVINHLLNPESRVNDIKFVSADKKTTVYDGPECTTIDKHTNVQYRIKLLSIAHCTNMIEKDEANTKYFNLFSASLQKHNLSDAFLLGAWYLKTIKDPLVKNLNSDGKYELVNIPVRPPPFAPKPRPKITPKPAQSTDQPTQSTDQPSQSTNQSTTTEVKNETIELQGPRPKRIYIRKNPNEPIKLKRKPNKNPKKKNPKKKKPKNSTPESNSNSTPESNQSPPDNSSPINSKTN